MAERTCLNCIYVCCDPGVWLRCLWAGVPPVPMCANHPQWPGQLHEVSGTPCKNYRPKPDTPEGDVRRIPVGDGVYTYVDAADYEWLSRYKWSCNSSGYVARREKGKLIFMHRQIMQPPPGVFVDHIDGNKLNNSRVNMRNCTREENMRNQGKRQGSKSRFKGVSRMKNGKWYARTNFNGEPVYLGCFDDEIEAARAYDRKVVELGIEFARLNFPKEWPPERRAEVRAAWLKAHPEPEGKKRPVKGKRGRPRTQAPAGKGRHRPTNKAKHPAGRSRKRPARHAERSRDAAPKMAGRKGRRAGGKR